MKINKVEMVDYDSSPISKAAAESHAKAFTKTYKEYYTAIPSGIDGKWIVTNRFDPRVLK